MVFNVNIVYGNFKSENFQDYAQKPQRIFTFMNSASLLVHYIHKITNIMGQKLRNVGAGEGGGVWIFYRIVKNTAYNQFKSKKIVPLPIFFVLYTRINSKVTIDLHTIEQQSL